jgi:hypothetical protein
MKVEHFKSEREFKLKFLSQMYICSNCEMITPSPYDCPSCGWSADGLFKTMNKGYKYQIDGQEEKEIFAPVEIIQERKQTQNERNSNNG